MECQQLLSFDFDGTIVSNQDIDNKLALSKMNNDGEVSAVNYEFVKQLEILSASGSAWVINTGRSIHHTVQGISIYKLPFPNFIIAMEKEIFVRNEFNRWVDFGDWNKNCARDFKQILRSERGFFSKFKIYIEGNTSGKHYSVPGMLDMVKLRDFDEVQPMLQYINAQIGPDSNLSYTYAIHDEHFFLQFLHKNYSKGTCLNHLREHFNLEKDDVFAIGDNYNDLSMLSGMYAKKIACPGNAIDEVKELVTEGGGFVAPENAIASDGIVLALNYYYA